MAEHTNKISANIQGVGFLVLGMLIFSLQDVAVKWIGGDYPVLEIVTMSGLGLVWARGMYFLARAYSLALALVVAPFEYLALPIHITWGFVLWREIPTWLTLAGAFLTLFSGIYILYRERRKRPVRVMASEGRV